MDAWDSLASIRSVRSDFTDAANVFGPGGTQLGTGFSSPWSQDSAAEAEKAVLEGLRDQMEERPQFSKPEYVHISSTDTWDSGSLWYTDRDNLLGTTAGPGWDPMKLINTDRPDFTDVASVVGDGIVQFETGMSRFNTEEGSVENMLEFYPSVLVRYGIGDRFELRLKSRSYLNQQLSDSTTGADGSINGFADPELGFKWVLKEQEDWVPMQTVVLRMGVPVGSNDVSANKLEPGLSYIYNWQIRRWWFLRGSTGVDLYNTPIASLTGTGFQVEHDHHFEISQSISSYMQITQNLGSFIEWFMLSEQSSHDDGANHFHNYGLYFYLTPDVQLDCRLGWRFGDSLGENFWSAGVSWRF